ncbi:MAG TPA: DmsC/YnfH family molybdoenzyme membrane anchor subunit [Xanthomonadales bacterium]|nr:DmsC/YnfH family molybdoenzyme membrane anchor subunit [Xanthomonadales bacterium]
MHPALSVVLFTTLASAGLGALAWLGLDLAFATGVVAPRRVAVVLFAGLLLLAAGLLASTWHLGVKSRAWRAFTQWRSSWLSREAWLSLLVFVPAGMLFLHAVGMADGVPVRALGATLAVLAIATLYATTRIYTTLKAIPAWVDEHVTPTFIALGFAAGGCWLLALASAPTKSTMCTGLVAVTWIVAIARKVMYWKSIDRKPLPSTRESATGLGRYGNVSVFEAPHTEANFLLKEMGYVLARRHGTKLRTICVVSFATCAVAMFVAIGAQQWLGAIAAVSLVPATLGVFVERWLFFAQARHVVTLYYGADPRAVTDAQRPSSAPAP